MNHGRNDSDGLHSTVRLALLVAALCAAALPARAQQGLVDCGIAAGACVTQCGVGIIFGGSGALKACREQCAAQHRVCQQQASTWPPVGNPAPAPGAAQPSAATQVPSAGGPEAHFHPLKTFTSSDMIVPVAMPVLDGVPVIGYSQMFMPRSPVRKEVLERGDANAQRWLLLQQIARSPESFDRAAGLALRLFVPPAAWDEYADCRGGGGSSSCIATIQSVTAGQAPDRYMTHPAVAVSWKGKNEFEKARSQTAFVEKYGPILREQAAKLPQEVVLVSMLHLQPYSQKAQAIPLADRAGNFLGFNAMAARSLPLVGPYCAPTVIEWPKAIQAPPADAEAMVSRLADRAAYIALRLRLTRVDAKSNNGSLLLGTLATEGCSSDARALGLALYTDAALTTKLVDLPLKVLPAPASQSFVEPVMSAPHMQGGGA